MYRYTAKKTAQANRKFAQKQAKKKTMKTSSKMAAQKKQKKQLATATKVKTKSAKTVKRENQAISRFWRILTGTIFFVILLYLIGMLILRFFLPQVFLFDDDRSVLLLDGTPEEKADKIYLLQLSPNNETVKVFALDPTALVPVSGGYGAYPLGYVASFLQLQSGETQKLAAIYNFALKQAIDEVYFVEDLQNLDSAAAIKGEIWGLIKKELSLTTTVRRELWEIYFFLQRELIFSEENLEIEEDEGIEAQFLAKEKLTQCPVVLINTTTINGLASKTSKMAEMNGLVVVNLENSSENLRESEIYYDETETDCLALVEILQNNFPAMNRFIPDGGEKGLQNRAKAVIKLGQNLSD